MNFFKKTFSYLEKAKTNSDFVKIDDQKKIEQIYDNVNRVNAFSNVQKPIKESETDVLIHKNKVDVLKNLNRK